MRWLLLKDLQILRRSPLLVGLLVVYPIAVALMIGFAAKGPPESFPITNPHTGGQRQRQRKAASNQPHPTKGV